jgi:hypothetical protein
VGFALRMVANRHQPTSALRVSHFIPRSMECSIVLHWCAKAFATDLTYGEDKELIRKNMN